MTTTVRPARENLSRTSYERVRDRLREGILDGQFPPGHRLKAVELARQFGVSLMPVREALLQLQGEGLIVVIPKRGAVVRVLDSKLVSQIFDIRIALEGSLAHSAALLATESDIEQLRQVIERHKQTKGDREAHMKNHLEFHEIINAISDNGEAIKILELHHQLIFGLRRKVGFGPTRIEEISADHDTIFSAIAAHDGEAAEKAAKAHVARSKSDMLTRMEECE